MIECDSWYEQFSDRPLSERGRWLSRRRNFDVFCRVRSEVPRRSKWVLLDFQLFLAATRVFYEGEKDKSRVLVEYSILKKQESTAWVLRMVLGGRCKIAS